MEADVKNRMYLLKTWNTFYHRFYKMSIKLLSQLVKQTASAIMGRRVYKSHSSIFKIVF